MGQAAGEMITWLITLIVSSFLFFPAQLNSAVTSDHRMVSREFILRDNKKSIPAVFYEIVSL